MDSGGSTESDGGTDASDDGGSSGDGSDTDSGGASVHNCDVDVDELTLCTEDAVASPGGVASVNVHVLRLEGCAVEIDGVGGPILLNDTYFLVDNAATTTEALMGLDNCVEMMTEVGFDAIYMWMWMTVE